MSCWCLAGGYPWYKLIGDTTTGEYYTLDRSSVGLPELHDRLTEDTTGDFCNGIQKTKVDKTLFTLGIDYSLKLKILNNTL